MAKQPKRQYFGNSWNHTLRTLLHLRVLLWHIHAQSGQNMFASGCYSEVDLVQRLYHKMLSQIYQMLSQCFGPGALSRWSVVADSLFGYAQEHTNIYICRSTGFRGLGAFGIFRIFWICFFPRFWDLGSQLIVFWKF